VIPEVVVFGQVAVIVVALVGSLAGIAAIFMRATHLSKRPGTLDSHSNAQLEQLQQSVDAIALEVERIAEAQRFSAKLLSERGEGQTDRSLAR
jgi:Tfp pilus assembly protein PilN